MSGRCIWIGALGGTVLIIAVLNMQGSQNQSVHALEDPALQAELLLLRERVATLERKLNARLLKQSDDALTLPPPDDAAAPTPLSGEELDVHRREKETRKVAERIAAEAEDAAKRAEAAARRVTESIAGSAGIMAPMQHAGGEIFLSEYQKRHAAALAGRERQRRLVRNESTTVIAVCASTTSRGLQPSGLEQLSLFRLALPSLVATFRHGASSEPVPELWVYVAYDVGDKFYDSAARELDVRAWLDTYVVGPLATAGVRAQHALLRFENALRKPGPIFNFMMAAAAEDGADYLYRINDDTEFVTPWVGLALSALRGYSPPNVGVVGPICREGNTRIITHDLVHRTHLEIFDYYYPPILSDWWMDDWITMVYDERHFTKGPFVVRHHVSMHGTRYSVDYAHEQMLQGELRSGRMQIQAWLAKRGS
jgi:hypothetical protein